MGSQIFSDGWMKQGDMGMIVNFFDLLLQNQKFVPAACFLVLQMCSFKTTQIWLKKPKPSSKGSLLEKSDIFILYRLHILKYCFILKINLAIMSRGKIQSSSQKRVFEMIQNWLKTL
jgi:hypothetical protein